MFKTPTFGGAGLTGNTALSGGGFFGQNKSFGTGTTGLGTTGLGGASGFPAGAGTGGLFGANTGTNVFQSPQQQQSQAGAGLFGQKTGTGLFSGSSGSGTTAGTGLFGQQSQFGGQASALSGGTSSFSSGATGGGIFTSGGSFSGQQVGPGTPVKFKPVHGRYSAPSKIGGYVQTITTALQAISGMKEYEKKSFEASGT
ncbi:uncharacterized protein [Oscarella lobularis]|uniref:uncharacterized protein n=1 Tax=Oscarella lobularis TaxID=121494 RepID=UPI003313C736